MNAFEGSIRVLGTGAAFPGPPVGNDELRDYITAFGDKRIGRAFRAVAERLAIRQRHFCRDLSTALAPARSGDANPDLAARAVRNALNSAHITADRIGYLMGHTATPHTQVPPNAAWVADRLGYNGAYGELRQACTGFANALLLLAPQVAAARSRPVAIVGSETGSVYFNPANSDQDQLVNLAQMGDGAGAILLGPHDSHGPRIHSIFYGTLGQGHNPGLSMKGSSDPIATNEFCQDFTQIKQLGPQLFDAGIRAARGLGIDVNSVAWVLPHQANGKMDSILSDLLGIPADKVIVTGDRFGNLGSAAIWCGLHEWRQSGRLRPGDEVLVLGAESTKYMYGGFVYVHDDPE